MPDRPSRPADAAGPAGCLAGLRVLDLSQWLPGPHAAQILADLGAQVMKVEPPAGDPARRLGLADADGQSLFWKQVNAGKQVVCLDLKSPVGKADFLRLVRRADVMLESFRPGALGRLGLDHASLRRENPRLVHTALSGWGQTGPYAGRAGHDNNYMALGGGLARSGTVERPVMAFPPVADMSSAMQAALATLAALLRRGTTGEGAFVDVSIMETVLGWQGSPQTQDAHGLLGRRGEGLLNGGAAYYNVYATAGGGFVTLGAIEEKFWENFSRAVGRPDWVARQAEPFPQSELIAEVSALFATRTRDQWRAILEPVDCCFEAVFEPAEAAAHPQVAARGLLRERDGLVEALFPAFLDGVGPGPRRPVEELTPADALAAWAA